MWQFPFRAPESEVPMGVNRNRVNALCGHSYIRVVHKEQACTGGAGMAEVDTGAGWKQAVQK
jgi:hypothetical protein